MLHNLEQDSDEWFAFRAGKFSASTVGDIMKKGRGGKPSTMRANAITRMAVERLTGVKDSGFSSAAMQRGIELEAMARDAYSFENRVAVLEVGCVSHDDMPYAICSPDGLVNEDGLVEIKCPETMPRHYDALNGGDKMAKEYKWQLQHQLFTTGRDWVDLVSYDPRFPDRLQMATQRIFPDAEAQEELKAEIIRAEMEVQEQVEAMKRLKGAA